MDLRKLRHAITVADESNFARAARKLRITQPALTRSIQALEASLGLRLFDRMTRGVVPTSAGRPLLEHARALLRLESGLLREARLLARGECGFVAVGCGPMLSPLLGSVLAEVHERAPALELRVEIETPDRLEALLLAEQIEFFIADTQAASTRDDFQVTAITEVPAGYYAAADHPLASRWKVTTAEIGRFPLAAPHLGATSAFMRIPGGTRVSCDDIPAIKGLALTSDTIILALSITLQPELAQGKLVRSISTGRGGWDEWVWSNWRDGRVHRRRNG